MDEYERNEYHHRKLEVSIAKLETNVVVRSFGIRETTMKMHNAKSASALIRPLPPASNLTTETRLIGRKSMTVKQDLQLRS